MDYIPFYGPVFEVLRALALAAGGTIIITWFNNRRADALARRNEENIERDWELDCKLRDAYIDRLEADIRYGLTLYREGKKNALEFLLTNLEAHLKERPRISRPTDGENPPT